jgi:hypothetical protein
MNKKDGIEKQLYYYQESSTDNEVTYPKTEWFNDCDKGVVCNNIETCSLKTSDGSTCGSTPAPSNLFSIDNSQVLTAKKDYIPGYSHYICMSCYIHPDLTKESIFKIMLEMKCYQYINAINDVVKDLQYQGDGA